MTDPPPGQRQPVIAISHTTTALGDTHGTGAFSLEPTLSVLDGLDHVEAGLVGGILRVVTASHDT